MGFPRFASQFLEKNKQHRKVKAANRTDCPGCGSKRVLTKDLESTPVIRGPLASESADNTRIPLQPNPPADLNGTLIVHNHSDWYHEAVNDTKPCTKKRQHRPYKQPVRMP